METTRILDTENEQSDRAKSPLGTGDARSGIHLLLQENHSDRHAEVLRTLHESSELVAQDSRLRNFPPPERSLVLHTLDQLHTLFHLWQSQEHQKSEQMYTGLYTSLHSLLQQTLPHDRDVEKSLHLLQKEAEEIAMIFFGKSRDLFQLHLTDRAVVPDRDPAANNAFIVSYYPGVQATLTHRLAHELYSLGAPTLARIFSEESHSRFGIDIHPGARIGKGFFIDHGTNVVIGETTDIGKNVTLYQGVTLGALRFERDEAGQLDRAKKRHPTLEDNVIVYANATILGGNTVIGANSVIGANVRIDQSIAPWTMVQTALPELKMKPRLSPRNAFTS